MSEETTKQTMTSEKAEIKKFISSISSKKYAVADKYLRNVIDTKIKNRINAALEKPLF